MSPGDVATVIFVTAGLVFFVAGTAGLLRFPDTHSRLHALTKADNLGLGLIVAGLAFRMPDGWSVAKLGLVWLLAVLAAATVAQLVARAALEELPETLRRAGELPATGMGARDRGTKDTGASEPQGEESQDGEPQNGRGRDG